MQLPESIIEIDAELSLEAHEYLSSDERKIDFPNLGLWPINSNSDGYELPTTWPPLATSLTLPQFYLERELPPFPEGVIDLTFKCSNGFPTIPQLSTNLTSLKCPDIGFSDMSQRNFGLPKTLTSLHLFKQREFNFRHFHLLPRRLLSLCVSTFRVEIFPVIPTSEEIAADVERSTALARKSLSKGDRKNWTRFNNIAQSPQTKLSTSNLQQIEAGLHFGLPLGLTSLQLDLCNLNSTEYMNIAVPPTVTRLSLSLEVCPRPLLSMKSMPPSITRLQIPGKNVDGAVTLLMLPEFEALLGHSVFPPNLTDLKLFGGPHEDAGTISLTCLANCYFSSRKSTRAKKVSFTTDQSKICLPTSNH